MSFINQTQPIIIGVDTGNGNTKTAYYHFPSAVITHNGDNYLTTIRESATQYVEGIMRRLREYGYDPGQMRLYVMGGGACLVKNFGSLDAERVTFNDDLCATAKGYETLAAHRLHSKGGSIV